MSADKQRRVTFFFTNGTKFRVRFPRQGGMDPATLLGNVRRALDADKLTFEIGGELFVIPMRNVQYIQITPAPEALPADVIRGASLVS
jgi:hypothetical protein